MLKKLNIQQDVFGNPSRIITDKGTVFTSNAFKQYCDTQSIVHIKITTTGIPRSNGQVEQINGILVSVLTKL